MKLMTWELFFGREKAIGNSCKFVYIDSIPYLRSAQRMKRSLRQSHWEPSRWWSCWARRGQAQAQDSEAPYLRMAPLDQYLMADQTPR